MKTSLTHTGESESLASSSIKHPKLSIVTPAFNEEECLQDLYDRTCQALDPFEEEWELIIVDDHSTDNTFQIIKQIAELDHRVHGIRLARNTGSHMALLCGIQHARGECAVTLASDLQDPPELILKMMELWKNTAQVVWAVREKREGESFFDVWFARQYYSLMRNIVGIKEMPTSGADFFLIDRKVIDALCQFRETHVSILALISWMGFRQETVNYNKRVREHGVSGWTLRKKLKLVVDSIVSFSYLPIRVMSYMGIVVAIIGFISAISIVIDALDGIPVEGWASLMVVILFVGGLQMVMIGVLGEYTWRALDEARRRPQFIVEAEINCPR